VLGVSEFVDADVFARPLPRSGAPRSRPARDARRLDELGTSGRDFGFETKRWQPVLAPRIRTLPGRYECHLVFLWLPSADLAGGEGGGSRGRGGHAVRSRRFVAATLGLRGVSDASLWNVSGRRQRDEA